ncbi:efflux RND transporter periplasmic adaptor subunit [Demequina gelatinilytica]|uniref:efflux RND transporter periplasmic adaptor subunit n=1 Tax=Demequina gelatinilytica TaxID=1638980 RepID=UPI00078418D0|nr:efflux RND transporter periplasmic adaptor subunit [Demequina gelatinilytica]
MARRRVRGWHVAAAPIAVGGVVAVVLLTGASSASAQYRVATAGTGDVTQTLTATGSLASASEQDLAFQLDGTVESLAVAVGDVVEAGDVLATLDTSDLDDAVTEAKEALADAKEALADDLEAQAEGTSSSSSTTTSSASYSTDGSTAGSSAAVTVTAALYVPGDTSIVTVAEESSDAVEAARAALVAAQDALLEQYDLATALLAEAQDAATAAQEVCAAFAATTDDDAAGDGSGTADDDGADTSDDGSADDAADALAACQEATSAALAASQASIDAQATLMELAAAVDDAVATLQEAIAAAASGTGTADGGTSGGTSGSTGGGSGTAQGGESDQGGMSGDQELSGTPSGDAASQDGSGASGMSGMSGTDGSSSQSSGGMGGSSSSSSSVPSAADILADKADITAAKAELAVARSQLEHATLTAPVAGEIVAIGFDEDDSVTGGDTSTAITLIADNTYLVSLSVSLTEAQLLEAGQDAELTLTSTGEVVAGTVSSVSHVNSGNDYSQSYAVTIAVPDPGFDIRIGAATRMQITVASATGVLVVPTSAISDAAGDATVQVVGEDGAASSVAIETGAIGAVYTEVLSGLDAGDQVVLADLTASVTSDDESSDSSGGLLSGLDGDSGSSDQQQMGQFPGGGMPQGGFQGGPQG